MLYQTSERKRLTPRKSQQLLRRFGRRRKAFNTEEGKCCNQVVPWKQYCALAQDLPEVAPDQLVELLYSFAQRDSQAIACYNSCVARHTADTVYKVLRQALCSVQALDAQDRLGGRDQDNNHRPRSGPPLLSLRSSEGFVYTRRTGGRRI